VPPSSNKSLLRLKQIRPADTVNDQMTGAQILDIDTTALSQEDYQNAMLSQLKRVIFGDGIGNWSADFVTAGLKSLSDLSSQSSVDHRIVAANCLSTDLVGNFVQISGPNSGPYYTVTTVDPSRNTGMPALGIIVTKQSTTQCLVQMTGLVDVGPLGITGLPVGKRCFVGYDGRPAFPPPPVSQSPTGTLLLQVVGLIVGSSLIELVPGLYLAKLLA
jgi:hypothetical protein